MILRRVCPTGESRQGTRKEPLRNEIFTPPEKKKEAKATTLLQNVVVV